MAQTSTDSLQAAIDDVVIASRILAMEGVLDAFGHVSIRHPEYDHLFLMSRSMAPALVVREDIMVFDMDGMATDRQDRSVFLERFIHSAIYRDKIEVAAVIHNHSPAVIPFGVSSVPMRPVCHNAGFLAHGVPVFDIQEAAGEDTNMLVSSDSLGRSLSEVLGKNSVALMRGHGCVVVGPSIQVAVCRAIYTEVNAKLQSLAMGLGGEVKYLSVGEAELADEVNVKVVGRPWDLWKKKALERLSNERLIPVVASA